MDFYIFISCIAIWIIGSIFFDFLSPTNSQIESPIIKGQNSGSKKVIHIRTSHRSQIISKVTTLEPEDNLSHNLAIESARRRQEKELAKSNIHEYSNIHNPVKIVSKQSKIVHVRHSKRCQIDISGKCTCYPKISLISSHKVRRNQC